MHLTPTIKSVFGELTEALTLLTYDEYTAPCSHLSNATIGQHVRHVIELFQCLINGYETAIVNYEARRRDQQIESDKMFAIDLLQAICGQINQADKALTLLVRFGEKLPVAVDTNYRRELIYNLEHAIHHMALIRVGIQQISQIQLPESFGVAPSTIQYREQCAP